MLALRNVVVQLALTINAFPTAVDVVVKRLCFIRMAVAVACANDGL